MSVDLKTFFDGVYLINLKRRRDRIVRWEKLVKEIGGWPLRDWQVVEAIDGGNDTVPFPIDWHSGGGAWGCRQSHIKIHQDALMAGHESILILEDDCEIRDDFITKLTEFLNKVPEDWEALMLGGQHMKDPELIEEGLVRCKNTQRTHALAFRGRAIKDVYQMYCGTNVHIDWRLGPFLGRRRQTYAPHPLLIGQTAGKSDITQRQTPAKFWNEPDTRGFVYLVAPRSVAEHCRLRGCHYGQDLNRNGRDRGLQKCFPKPGVYTGGINNFVSCIGWECESFSEAPGIPTVWDVNATAETHNLVQKKNPSTRFDLIVADTNEEAERQFAEHKDFGPLFFARKRNIRKPVILLQASREIRDHLDHHDIIHCGFWRDDDTGIDMGLTSIMNNKQPNLGKWITEIRIEAEFRAALPCIWHPAITEKIAETTGERVIVVKAKNIDEAINQCDEALP